MNNTSFFVKKLLSVIDSSTRKKLLKGYWLVLILTEEKNFWKSLFLFVFWYLPSWKYKNKCKIAVIRPLESNFNEKTSSKGRICDQQHNHAKQITSNRHRAFASRHPSSLGKITVRVRSRGQIVPRKEISSGPRHVGRYRTAELQLHCSGAGHAAREHEWNRGRTRAWELGVTPRTRPTDADPGRRSCAGERLLHDCKHTMGHGWYRVGRRQMLTITAG